jgi:hypothetical protein
MGLLVFLGGIALLLVTFRLAYDMFTVSPDQALHLEKGQTLDVALAGRSFGVLILRVLLLIVMGLMGSMIANRGIKLYAECLARRLAEASRLTGHEN